MPSDDACFKWIGTLAFLGLLTSPCPAIATPPGGSLAIPVAPEVTPPCTELGYGTAEQARAIENAMYLGTVADARFAVRAAQATRAQQLGCSERAVPRVAAETAAQTATEVRLAWELDHAPLFDIFSSGCPPIGREWPSAALGALLAGLAGEELDLAVVESIADGAVDAQYSPETAGPEPVSWLGLYGYGESLAEMGACFRGGGVSSAIEALCGPESPVCPVYEAGAFAGQRFVIADFVEEPRFYDGGAAYDHGWTAAMMLELALQHPDAERAAAYRDSFLLAAEWSAREPAVRNHNYTAKNVWVLAQAYGLTGEQRYHDALLDRLDRNLIPGVLMDQDCDGMVDGVDGVAFDSLTAVAQRPGRMWDAHNATTWYQAMNAWALVEAYAALRDRGDRAEAERVAPYALAATDNLAWEINEAGGPNITGPGRLPVPFAIATALWKIADAEDTPYPQWERAAWVLWHGPAMQAGTSHRTLASAALYLLHVTRTPYRPLGER